MAIFGETVNLVNRTKKLLNARFDGRDEAIFPGENPGFPKVAVTYAKRQNPLMGSEDPQNPTLSGCEYLVGVKVKTGEQQVDDITPLEQNEEAPQRFNRDTLHEKGYKEVVKKNRINRFEAATPSNSELGDLG